jgi:hypothetical protein
MHLLLLLPLGRARTVSGASPSVFLIIAPFHASVYVTNRRYAVTVSEADLGGSGLLMVEASDLDSAALYVCFRFF